MKTLCYSVRIESITEISTKCFKATGFDGSESLIPKSQVFGQDYEVYKSEAYWVSAWFLEQKDLQFSRKKEAFFDSETRKKLPSISYQKHTPKQIIVKEIKHDGSLFR